MSTLEKVEEEVRRLLAVWKLGDSSEAKYKREAYEELMPFLDTLQEEPESEGLNVEAIRLFGDCRVRKGAFKLGAMWQKEQMQHNTEAAKQFIKDYTRTCSNETISGLYESWLTPEQALRAVEIAAGK